MTAPPRQWTREECIQLLQQSAREQGKTPGSGDWAGHGNPSIGVVRKHFSTWNNFVLAAGLTPNKIGGVQAPRKSRRERLDAAKVEEKVSHSNGQVDRRVESALQVAVKETEHKLRKLQAAQAVLSEV